MSPDEKGSGDRPNEPEERKPTASEVARAKREASGDTHEYELGEDFLADLDTGRPAEEEPPAEEPAAEEEEELEEDEVEDAEIEAEESAASEVHAEEDLDDEEEIEDEHLADEELEGEEAVDEETELEELVSAETQEWEGIDAVADEKDEAPPERDEQPTLVAAAGERLSDARSKVSSGFESLAGGDRVASGLKRAREWRPRGFPLWARFMTASVAIIVSVAAATAASLILYLGDIAHALRDQTGALANVDKFLTRVPSSGPQTILILGSDKRPEDKKSSFKGLSDTTMLLRLDPDRNAIALFSLPRDLKVTIPGAGTDKLNAAYAYGGPQLTLQTVETLLSTQSEELSGQPFEVNHLVNVDFEGFARAVNALDCVYVDVDRRYFNSNVGKAASETYDEIDLQPGYQALCGFDALDYARYRHTDNDVVRAARQSEFLREARAKIPPERLFEDRKELISIFTEHTTSDINDPQTMLQVLKLFLDAREVPVKQVHFQGSLGPSFVTTTPEELRQALKEFFGFQATPGGGQSAAPEEPVTPEVAPDQVPVPPAAPSGKQAKAAPAPAAAPTPTGGTTDDTFSLTPVGFGTELAKGMRNRVAYGLPILYPTVLESGSDFAQKPRVYKINGTGEGSPPAGERPAYKWVFSRPALGEYYGFEATLWKDPPILNDPDEERTIGDRTYKIFYDGDRVRILAWQDGNASFWLSNTLIESLSDREMVKIAQGMKELPAS